MFTVKKQPLATSKISRVAHLLPYCIQILTMQATKLSPICSSVLEIHSTYRHVSTAGLPFKLSFSTTLWGIDTTPSNSRRDYENTILHHSHPPTYGHFDIYKQVYHYTNSCISVPFNNLHQFLLTSL